MPYYPYSDLLMDHFMNPRHVGTLADASGAAEVKNNTCGDVTRIEVRLKGDTVDSARFLGKGCGPGIACADYLIQLSIGRSAAAVRAISANDLARMLELPAPKLHAAELAVTAMRQALDDAESRQRSSQTIAQTGGAVDAAAH